MWSDVTSDTILAGYLVGGIKSDLPLGFINNPTLVTRAHDTIYKVYLIKGKFETGIEKIKSQPAFAIEKIYPMPSSGIINIDLSVNESTIVEIKIRNLQGKQLQTKNFGRVNSGSQHLTFTTQLPAGMYLLSVSGNSTLVNAKVVIE